MTDFSSHATLSLDDNIVDDNLMIVPSDTNFNAPSGPAIDNHVQDPF